MIEGMFQGMEDNICDSCHDVAADDGYDVG